MNHIQRDRFELLSAYLDGEVTAAERQQVESWLAHDPTVQRLYARLLKLRYGIRNLPSPPMAQPAEEAASQVFKRLERRPRRIATWGGMAIAAVFVGFLANMVPVNQSAVHQFAIDPESSEIASTALMIDLDQPIIAIPKASVSLPLEPAQITIQTPGVMR